MEYHNNQFNIVDRQIMKAFNEIEDTLATLRDLINMRGKSTSSLAWFPKIMECEKQLSKLFITTYAAEVFFRHPEGNSVNNSELH